MGWRGGWQAFTAAVWSAFSRAQGGRPGDVERGPGPVPQRDPAGGGPSEAPPSSLLVGYQGSTGVLW